MSPLVDRWFELAVQQLWQVTALAIVVGLAVRLACHRRPHLAYLLWMLVVVKCLTPPVWSSPTGLFSWARVRRVETMDAAVSRVALTAPVAPVPTAFPRPADLPVVRAQRMALPLDAATFPDRPPQVVVPGPYSDRLFSLAAVLAIAWLAGSTALAVLIGLKWVSYARTIRRSAMSVDPRLESLVAGVARRLGVRGGLRLAVVSEPTGPAVFGLVRPLIVLPASVLSGRTDEQIEPVLAHELVHIRRGDLAAGLVQMAAQILWWFHPLVWWANRAACRQRERCCDEEVVVGLPCRPCAYARSLLVVLESQRLGLPLLSVPGMKQSGVTRNRVEDIMTRANAFHRRTPGWCWAVLAIAAALALPGRELVLDRGVLGESANSKENRAMTTQTNTGDDERAVIVGRVLDPAHKPVSGAQVVVLGWSAQPGRGGDLGSQSKRLGTATARDDGAFRAEVPWLSSAAFHYVNVFATARGHGLGVAQPLLDAPEQELSIELPEEQAIHGQVRDPEGHPAAGAKVAVHWIGGAERGVTWWDPANPPPHWPQPSITDDQGRFTIRGVNRQRGFWLEVFDDRFARWYLEVQPPGARPSEEDQDPPAERYEYLARAGKRLFPKTVTEDIILAPPLAQIIQGQVFLADTQQPASGARLTVYARAIEYGSAIGVAGRADGEGRFRINPYPGKFFDVTAYPPDDQPYLAWQQTITWPERGGDQLRMSFNLPRGVLVRGQVVEASSGDPVVGAGIQYDARSKNPWMNDHILAGWPATVTSGPDGRFQIAVPPGLGTLIVHGPTGDYVARVLAGSEVYEGRPGGHRNYVHGFVPLDLQPDQSPHEVAVSIQRGVTVQGRLVGPRGQPVEEALVLSALRARYDLRWRGFPATARNGHFELHGLDPERPSVAYFLDAKNQWGARAEVSGRAPGEPLVVRLQPCGLAVARFVDTDGKPRAAYEPLLKIVITPGVSPFPTVRSMAAVKQGEWLADEDFVGNVDREHYWDHPKSDAEGRVTFPALIPGALYRVHHYDNDIKDWASKDFTVQPGETLQLGEITVKRAEN